MKNTCSKYFYVESVQNGIHYFHNNNFHCFPFICRRTIVYQKIHWFNERNFISSNVLDYRIRASFILVIFMCWMLVMRHSIFIVYLSISMHTKWQTGLKKEKWKKMVVPIICDEWWAAVWTTKSTIRLLKYVHRSFFSCWKMCALSNEIHSNFKHHGFLSDGHR